MTHQHNKSQNKRREWKFKVHMYKSANVQVCKGRKGCMFEFIRNLVSDKNSVHVSIWTHICQLPYQVEVEAVGVEMEGEEEGRLENLVHQGSWVGELGWSFSWGGGAQRGKAPVSPATGRSCGPGMEATQHSGGAHCWGTKGIQQRVLLIDILLEQTMILNISKSVWDR